MIHITDATFAYPLRALFADLNVTVNDGELLHVCGANGTGKSTLLQILAGLIKLQRGKIEFSPSEHDPRQLVEYLPADGSGLFPKLSAHDNLRFWSQLRHTDVSDQQITTELQRWQLAAPALRFLPVEKFSTGMRRRTALARVMLAKARYWLLDEPFNGLDQHGIETCVGMLREHLQSGGCVVISAHEASYFQSCKPKVLHLGRQ